ncbi:hypothetical protein DVJ78_05630 [Humibacter sp. BT305]|nr:hypothetical protein DVJ78_05630 [Humibacter sp. BT305]
MTGPHAHRQRSSSLRATTSVLAAAATAAALLLAGAPGANAAGESPASDISDPIALMSVLAPDLLQQTSASGLGVQDPALFSVALPADSRGEVALRPTATEGSGQATSIRLADQTAPGVEGRSQGGITVFDQGASATYVQPLTSGVRLLTAYADASTGGDRAFELDLPDGATATALPTGDTVVADAEGRYIGSVLQPWAVDASGRQLPTSYSWDGDVLTQHVDLADAEFPVLADPTWYYSYDFWAGLPGYHANVPKTPDYQADAMLHNCFNCYFPIGNAPRAYPKDGDVINLNASPFSFIVIPAPVKVQTAMGGALQFVAARGHFDGAGSMVTFSWYNDASGYLHLYVHAMVLRDLGSVVNAHNALIAGANWLTFWQRIVDRTGTSPGAGGV